MHGLGALRLNCWTIGWVEPDEPQSKIFILPVSVAPTICVLSIKNVHVDVKKVSGCVGSVVIMSIEYSIAGGG